MLAETWHDQIWKEYAHFFDSDRPFSTGMATLPDGWRQLIDTTFDRIALVVETDKSASFSVRRLFAERGVLTVRWKASRLRFERKMNDIVDRASARSACTCQTCGGAGVRYRADHDAVVACPTHRPPAAKEIWPSWPLIRVERAFVAGRSTIVGCRLYDRSQDRFVDADPAALGIDR